MRDLADCSKSVRELWEYLEKSNRGAPNDSERRALGSSKQLALHKVEARMLHEVKPHIETLKLYEWHMLSARRQGECLKSIRDGGLPAHALLIHFDYKENVRYPNGEGRDG